MEFIQKYSLATNRRSVMKKKNSWDRIWSNPSTQRYCKVRILLIIFSRFFSYFFPFLSCDSSVSLSHSCSKWSKEIRKYRGGRNREREKKRIERDYLITTLILPVSGVLLQVTCHLIPLPVGSKESHGERNKNRKGEKETERESYT